MIRDSYHILRYRVQSGKLSTTFIKVPKKDSFLIAENSSLPDGKLLDLGSGKL